MNKSKTARALALFARLSPLGYTPDEVLSLIRCESALSRWDCALCSGDIQEVDAENGVFFRFYGRCHELSAPTRNTGGAALKRAQAIAQAHGCTVRHQGDPRGCSLYLVPAGVSYDDEGKQIAICV